MRRAVLLAVGVALMSPAAALAQAPVFTPRVAIGGPADWWPPSVAIGPSGDVTVAWEGRKPFYREAPRPETLGVFVATRPAGASTFSPPVRVSSDSAHGVKVARNDRGDIALVWSLVPSPRGESGVRFAFGPAGGAFGAPEVVPLPAGEGGPDVDGGSPEVAIGGDGTALLGYILGTAETSKAVAIVRTSGGFGPARVLAPSFTPPAVASDGDRRLYAAWSGKTAGQEGVYFAEREGSGFASPQLLSAPGDDAVIAWPLQLRANRAGGLLVAWSSYVQADPPETRAHVNAAMRPARGKWQKSRRIGTGEVPSAALNDAGDAAVNWWSESPEGVGLAYSPAWSGFGAPELIPSGVGLREPLALAVDSLGTAIVAWRDFSPHPPAVFAALRPRTGPLGVVTPVSAPDKETWTPALATDRFDNGVVAWTESEVDGPTVYVSSYSATPPAVSGFKVKRSSFAFDLDEPALVQLTLKRNGGPAASLTKRSRAGREVVRFDARMRRMLRRPGRYRATIQARDAGPGASRVRTVTFSR
jgi:hypothetical protein